MLCTDIFKSLSWPGIPQAVIGAVENMDKWLVEGVQVPRALRKGLAPDIVVWLPAALAPRTPAQERMAKGVATTFVDWARDTNIEIRSIRLDAK